MEPLQLRFAFTTSITLAILGIILALSGLADWGLTIVALILMTTNAVSWWHGRLELGLVAEPLRQPAVARVSAQ